MFRLFLVALVASVTARAAAPVPTAAELMAAMDKNLQFETRSSISKMTVVEGTRTREYRMQSFGRGEDSAAVEYLSPEREKGTRMLKLGEELWLYMPRAERVQKISGHMLRQGMMGSDLSYEDMMAGSEFEENYTATVLGPEDQGGRPCWKLEAIAKNETVTYTKRVIWIDQANLVPLRQEMYAVSGMLLKTWTMDDIRDVEGKHVPFHMVIADQLRVGSRTELTTEEVKFGVPLEDEVFSTRWLERK